MGMGTPIMCSEAADLLGISVAARYLRDPVRVEGCRQEIILRSDEWSAGEGAGEEVAPQGDCSISGRAVRASRRQSWMRHTDVQRVYAFGVSVRPVVAERS